MNKVICDICGTTYPEAASQCPICGCAKPEGAAAVTDDAALAEGVSTYTYVKGGRFSNSNVRKRNQGKTVSEKPAPRKPASTRPASTRPASTRPATEMPASQKSASRRPKPVRDPEEDDDDAPITNGGLVVILILLILAIIAVGLYLYFNYLKPTEELPEEPDPIGTSNSAIAEPTETEPIVIPCQSLEVSQTEVTLTEVGNAWLMNVVPVPVDTTDSIKYQTSDETVATVSNEGCVTAVGPGKATITITCGEAVVECQVTCDIVLPTEAPTEPTTEPTTEPQAEWELNRTDITMKVGERWTLYEGTVNKADIKFSSDNESVATFKNGVVTAVGAGTTTVRAEYNGVKFSCIIRCKAAE